MDSSDLINYFKSNNVRFRIEVEGKASDLQWEGIKPNGDNSVKVLPEYSNKWGVEYRLYFNGNVPDKYQYLVIQNSFYNTDMYKNVINNNLIRDMLSTENCHLSVCIMIYKNKSKLIKHIEKNIKNQKLNKNSEFRIDIGDSEKIQSSIIDFRFNFYEIIKDIKDLIDNETKYSPNCNKVIFNNEVYFRNIELKGCADFSGAFFKKEVYFNSMSFNDKIDFSDSIFERDISFYNTYFNKEANL